MKPRDIFIKACNEIAILLSQWDLSRLKMDNVEKDFKDKNLTLKYGFVQVYIIHLVMWLYIH